MNPLRLAAVLTTAATIAALGSAPAFAASEPGCDYEHPITLFDVADGDNPVVMRACGSSQGHIECTGWF